MTKKAKKPDASAKRAGKEVGFSIFAPDAKQLFLAGDFNSWSERATPMEKDLDGVWRVKIKLQPGRHEFKYIADGVWIENLSGSDSVRNASGTRNCVVTVE